MNRLVKDRLVMDPADITYFGCVLGGDHGKGAFRINAKLVIVKNGESKLVRQLQRLLMDVDRARRFIARTPLMRRTNP